LKLADSVCVCVVFTRPHYGRFSCSWSQTGV